MFQSLYRENSTTIAKNRSVYHGGLSGHFAI